MSSIPEKGLPVKWRVPVAYGYAGPAVAGGKVYVTDYVKKTGEIRNSPSARDTLTGSERIRCLDAATGKQIWEYAYDRPYAVSYGSGPRATPAVAQGLVVSLGAEGDLVCLKAEDGSPVWKKDLNKEYKTETPLWGHSAHPLIVGDTLYCLVGGSGSLAVAFDLKTGHETWKALSAPESQGYCPPTMIRHEGKEQLLIWDPRNISSLNPADGAVNWTVKLQPAYQMSIAAPRLSGDLLFAGGMGREAVLLELGGAEPKEVWRGTPKTAVYSVNSTPFLEDGVIYGCDADTSNFVAVDMKDGQRLWTTLAPTIGEGKKGRHGTAFIVKNGDRFWLFSETGDLILAKLSRDTYEELGRFKVL
ncbi:MAG: PQQ-binding-like beta-propeller repeat protein, partial [Verrucomicrobiota bacterium]